MAPNQTDRSTLCFQLIREVCVAIAKDESRLQIVKNESDETTSYEPEADEFLKIDGKRLGRDFKMYGFMAATAGVQPALADFAAVLMAVKRELPLAFENARQLVEGWKEYFDGDMRDKWVDLWS